MRIWMRGAAFLATTGALLMLAAAGGCGSDKKKGGGTTPVTVPNDLNFEIQSADVPATGNPTVTFRATDASGQPIDLLKEIKNGASTFPRMSTAPRFTIAELQADGTYLDLYETTATGKAVTGLAGTPALPTATQAVAVAVPATDPALSQQLVAKGDGVYTFELVPAATATRRADLDPTKTHTVGMWGTRTLPLEGAAATGDAGHPAHATFNFVPSGGGTAATREVVNDQACNTCHTVLEAHDRRTGTQLCLTCHSPQTTDPESGNTVDFRVMIHKIHRGVNLPSVRSGTPYQIVGFAAGNPTPLPATAVHDFSDVNFPRSVTDCTACHQGAQADNWKNAPGREACLSCHDNVKFDASAGATVCAPGVTAPCNHKGGQISPTTACSACHTAGEITGAHVNAIAAASARFQYEIVGVTLGADRKPVVQVRVTDPTAGNAPYVLNANGGGTPSEPWTFTSAAPPVGGASRLFVDIGWPAEENVNTGGSATGPGQPVTVNVLGTATAVAGQAGVFQVTSPTAVPADTSFTVALEGHPGVKVNDTTYQRIPVTNDVKYFSATGAPNGPARREVVSAQKCNACHGMISFHGSNRTNTTQVCVVCHNSDATDKGQRITANITEPETPIDPNRTIHAIHATGMKQPFTIIGFGGSQNPFPAEFPGRVDNCNHCHLNDSWKLPLQDVVRDTTYDTGAAVADPSDNLRWNKTKSVCSSCHDSDQARTHIDSILAENPPRQCSECHGAGGVKDVAKVHRIVPNPP